MLIFLKELSAQYILIFMMLGLRKLSVAKFTKNGRRANQPILRVSMRSSI